MATLTSAHLSIAGGPAPGTVVVGVHGALDVAATTNLQSVCDGILEDRDVLAISVDLHDAQGVDVDGIASLATVANRAEQRNAEFTLDDPPELLCQALELAGLTGLIRMGHQERRPTYPAADLSQRQARRRHPSGGLLLVEEIELGTKPPT